MANQEHVAIFMQGVDRWNQWRKEHRDIQPDLRGLNLDGAQLDDVRLSFSQLQHSHFQAASLCRAYFVSSDLSSAHLTNTCLSEAHLDSTKLMHAHLNGSVLTAAKMRRANLSQADLSGADLSYAQLEQANLSSACVTNTNFSFARMGGTDLGHVNLATAMGLETVVHTGASHIGLHTIQRSHDDIPSRFLQGTKVPSSFLSYPHSIEHQSVQCATCMIIYAENDQRFAEQLQADLRAHGVLCDATSYDNENTTRREYIEAISEYILIYDALLLVVADQSLTPTSRSLLNAVVKDALARERCARSHENARTILFPLHLGKEPQAIGGVWTRLLQLAGRSSQDFTQWHGPDTYQAAFDQLLEELARSPMAITRTKSSYRQIEKACHDRSTKNF